MPALPQRRPPSPHFPKTSVHLNILPYPTPYSNVVRMEKISLRALNEKQSAMVVAISSDRALRKHLTEMGFDPGSIVTVINKGSSGLIVVEIKGCCRVAISTDMAEKILVEGVNGER